MTDMLFDNNIVTSTVGTDARSLFDYALTISENQLKDLTREVEECSIALKQVVRTYNLV